MKPFVIQNRTGYDMRFWNMSSDVEDGDTNVCLMKDGQNQDWTFRDWKKRKDVSLPQLEEKQNRY